MVTQPIKNTGKESGAYASDSSIVICDLFVISFVIFFKDENILKGIQKRRKNGNVICDFFFIYIRRKLRNIKIYGKKIYFYYSICSKLTDGGSHITDHKLRFMIKNKQSCDFCDFYPDTSRLSKNEILRFA